jgi:UDP-N-acetylmuramoyl-tripeptide--D-alanyl-D-alanine ligase
MKLSSSEISQAIGAIRQPAHDEIVPVGYSIDSRTIRPGECFIAIRGRNFDGHQFISEALSKGASLLIANTNTGNHWPSHSPILIVENTLLALQRLATHVRAKWGKRLVAITGSTGKTTTKDITSFILASRFRVFKTPGNFNNEYGLPLSLLRLQEFDEIAVIELGMSAPGEIARLSRIAGPNIGVVTNVKPVHLEFFKSIQGIAEAKRELIEQLPSNGVAVLNNDDVRVRKFGRHFPGQILTYGMQTAATYRASETQFSDLGGTEFRLDHKGKGYLFGLPLIGVHNVYNCLPAIAVAHHLGLGLEVIDQRIRLLQPSAGRGEILRFVDFAVINDSYNSNPSALEAMIHFLKRVPKAKRRILVAGEMLELGPRSSEFHFSSGRTAAKAGVDFILGVQGQAVNFVHAARKQGFGDDRAMFFETATAAGEWLSRHVRAGDLILVKGSRSVKTEQVIEILKQNHQLVSKT